MKKNIAMKILTSGIPIKQRAYHTPLRKRTVMEKVIKQLLDQVVIQPFISPWSSPCLLVDKWLCLLLCRTHPIRGQ